MFWLQQKKQNMKGLINIAGKPAIHAKTHCEVVGTL